MLLKGTTYQNSWNILPKKVKLEYDQYIDLNPDSQ